MGEPFPIPFPRAPEWWSPPETPPHWVARWTSFWKPMAPVRTIPGRLAGGPWWRRPVTVPTGSSTGPRPPRFWRKPWHRWTPWRGPARRPCPSLRSPPMRPGPPTVPTRPGHRRHQTRQTPPSTPTGSAFASLWTTGPEPRDCSPTWWIGGAPGWPIASWIWAPGPDRTCGIWLLDSRGPSDGPWWITTRTSWPGSVGPLHPGPSTSARWIPWWRTWPVGALSRWPEPTWSPPPHSWTWCRGSGSGDWCRRVSRRERRPSSPSPTTEPSGGPGPPERWTRMAAMWRAERGSATDGSWTPSTGTSTGTRGRGERWVPGPRKRRPGSSVGRGIDVASCRLPGFWAPQMHRWSVNSLTVGPERPPRWPPDGPMPSDAGHASARNRSPPERFRSRWAIWICWLSRRRPGEGPDGSTGRPPVKSRWGRAGLRWLPGLLVLVGILYWLGGAGLGDRLRNLSPGWVLVALLLSVLQVVISAWRWRFTAARLGMRLPFRRALAEYYLAGFLNQVLPGGVVGDVTRAWRHAGRDVRAGRAFRAVILERASGQVIMTGVALASLVLMVSTMVGGGSAADGEILRGWLVTGAVAVASLGVVGAAAYRFLHRRLRAEIRRALLGRRALPVQMVTSALVVASYLAVYLASARAVGVETPVSVLLPLVAPVLVAMLIPLTVAGWGVREGAAALVWAAVGLGAAEGVAISVAYGLLVLVSTLPGGLVLLWGPVSPGGWKPRTGDPDRRARRSPGERSGSEA
ncbi:MAG: hypothetical protein EA422_04565 [Gemmatimonadales bacterium]|nr:MAG: hypothetical protein EA422_04565 [Gemmatimonadales bacterium]